MACAGWVTALGRRSSGVDRWGRGVIVNVSECWHVED